MSFAEYKTDLRSKLEDKFLGLDAEEEITLRIIIKFAIESWNETISKLTERQTLQLTRIVKSTVSSYIHERGGDVTVFTLILLILKSQKKMSDLLEEDAAPVQVALEDKRGRSPPPRPRARPVKPEPEPEVEPDDDESIPSTIPEDSDGDAVVEEDEEEILDYTVPTSEEFTDPSDPAKRKIDYKGRDFKLTPKRGVYKKWHNIIRFNAPEHFRDRYLKAYARHAKESPEKPHGEVDRLARSTVYKTLTPAQIGDYVNRVRYGNRDKPSVYPVESADAFDWKKKSIWESRRHYFDHDLDAPTDAKSQLSESEEKVPDGEIGEDLLPDSYKRMTKDQYLALRAKIEEELKEKVMESVTKGVKMHLTAAEKRKLEVDKKENLKKAVDDAIRERYLPYALEKPYKRWYPAFTAKLQKHYPHRYKSVIEKDKLDGFRQSSKARTETLRAFNQKQLDEWRQRVEHQTGDLMSKKDYLPDKGTLKISPHFDEDNRKARLADFIAYKARLAEAEEEIFDDDDESGKDEPEGGVEEGDSKAEKREGQVDENEDEDQIEELADDSD